MTSGVFEPDVTVGATIGRSSALILLTSPTLINCRRSNGSKLAGFLGELSMRLRLRFMAFSLFVWQREIACSPVSRAPPPAAQPPASSPEKDGIKRLMPPVTARFRRDSLPVVHGRVGARARSGGTR